MGHVEAGILDLVAKLYPDVFARLDDYAARNRDYVDAVTVVRPRSAVLPRIPGVRRAARAGRAQFCYPQVSARTNEITANGTFDLALASKLVSEKASRIQRLRAARRGADPGRLRPQQGRQDHVRPGVRATALPGQPRAPGPWPQAGLLLPDEVYTHFERGENLRTCTASWKTSSPGSTGSCQATAAASW